ncbi:MAG: TolC family protein, partial [Gemmatimonadales bacterium]
MIGLMLLALQASPTTPPPDSLPRVTLAQALERATRLDPGYVRALGQVDNAEWGRRAARLAFILPSVNAGLDASAFSVAFFNLGTGRPQFQSYTARLSGSYEVFSLRKFAELSRSRAELEGAQAGELQARFASALLTESDYYGVLANQELSRVAAERVRRGEEQLSVARARVLAGAAVHSDSLQLVLELTQARLDLLRQESALRVARLQLGRRIGAAGPVEAAPIDTVAPDLPLDVPEALRLALDQGPQYQVARANERAAVAELRAERGGYLPQLTLSGAYQQFDSEFFPSGRKVSSMSLSLSLPIWNNGQRELAVTQARVSRDVFRAIRQDLERAAARDVTEAYEAYTTAQASIGLSGTAVVVARENFRVQDSRYRAGATTILDVLEAQVRLTQSEA